MKKLLVLFLFIAGFFMKAESQVAIQDSLELVQLYYNTTPQWWVNKTNWNSASPVSNWYGITVANNRVTGINLRNNGLNGPIISTIGTFDSLKVLDLSYNWITGTLPSSLGDLRQLKSFSVGKTPNGNYVDYYLTGTIPAELGNLTKLETLELGYTNISGALPASLGNLVNLKTLDLTDSDVSGNIPASLGNCTSLVVLNLGITFFTGSIPASFQNLANLVTLTFGRPPDYGQGHLSGDLSFIGSLHKLKSLDLSYNDFTEIPDNIGNADSLVAINLAHNQFSNVIPASIGNLSTLTYIDCSNNAITGNLPETITGCTILGTFIADNNQLSGSLPDFLATLSSLRRLSLANNHFSGSIPASWNNLGALQEINISNNSISGQIRPIGNPAVMRTINCSNNQLMGTVNDFAAYQQLSGLYVNNNLLSGSIAALAGLTANCDVSSNNFSGPVPVFPSRYPNLINNNFVFAGMEAMVQHQVVTGDTSNNYAPQKSIGLTRNGNLLSVSVGGTPANNTYRWYKDNVLVATITADSSFTATATGNYAVTVKNAVANKLTLYSDTLNIAFLLRPLCEANGNTIFAAGVSGSSYQWQVNTGNGFINIVADDANHSGTFTDSLHLNNIPGQWYGYEYRCLANGNPGNVFRIQFINQWTGSQDTQWENSANWSCAVVPGPNTDVKISSGTVVVNSNTSIRSLQVDPAVLFTVSAGVILTVMH